MEKRISKWMGLILVIALTGCAATLLIQNRSDSERMDVFREVGNEREIPKGFAELVIRSFIKTPPVGFYLFEWKKSANGIPNYTFLLNIDGQAITWEINGYQENATFYDVKGGLNPERGEGIKYILQKKIQLRSGPHKFFFALPSDVIFLEGNITLQDHHSYILDFIPIYRGSLLQPRFINGIREIRAIYDGHPL